ncbi:cysteine desulfurase family protein [Microbacterium halophytorum]|uniref:cysteine desulfurase family protein n=1 Tax=Microbacterium halophytorum TaxID=2067568 RepID=UPI000CFAF999|nr:cysteine desulfurase family protein [Microbacterium halophytorum]
MLYLDHAATTPVRREVLEAITPHLTTEFGNPSSAHSAGERAREALDGARHRVAAALGARPGDVVFTSGGTEANNLAVQGIGFAAALGRGARHIVTTPIEHSSLLEPARFLARVHGFEVTEVPVDRYGRVDPAGIARVLRPDTALVAVGAANNEIGTVQPVAEIAAACRESGVPLHVDAVQAAGWLPLGDLGADSIAVSGHKLGGLQGTGALAVRRRIPLEPILHGGGQERGARSGTENVAGAVALGVALELAERERAEAAARVARIRDAFVDEVLNRAPNAWLTGHPDDRLPSIASFVLPGVNGESVLIELARSGVLASSGSACRAGSTEPSHVLLAAGFDADTARTAIRFSLPRGLDSSLSPVARALADAADTLAA